MTVTSSTTTASTCTMTTTTASISSSIYLFCFAAGVLYGPLHSQAAVDAYKKTVAEAQQQGGKIEYGGNVSYL